MLRGWWGRLPKKYLNNCGQDDASQLVKLASNFECFLNYLDGHLPKFKLSRDIKAVWPTPTKKRKRKYGTDQWKMEKKTQTCGKGPTEGDRLSGHEMEVEESLLLHLGFVPGRAARGRSCLSPAWRKISSNTFLLLFSRKRKSIKLWVRKIIKYFFESQLFVC